MRVTKYSVGQRWYCDRSVGSNPYNRPPFWFVIVGVSRPGYKLCVIEHTQRAFVPIGEEEGCVHEYSHKHLMTYAVHMEAKK